MTDPGGRYTLASRVVRTLDQLDGLSPVTIVRAPEWARRGPDPRVLAVTLHTDPVVVEVRLVATALPLPPLLERATAALRAVVAGTDWAQATIRLVVTTLDPRALQAR